MCLKEICLHDFTVYTRSIFLISHFFKESAEKTNSAELISDDRVIALFVGHHHHADVTTLGDEFGNKSLIFAGNYSYGDSETDPGETPWGFRDLVLGEDKVTSTYIIPKNKITVNNSTVKIRAKEKNVFEYYVTR